MEVDGVISEREVDRIGEVYEGIVGFRLEPSVRDKLIDTVILKQDEVLDLIRVRADLLDNERRKLVPRAGLMVLQADLRARHREWRFLRDVGAALGMTKSEIDEAL